MNPIANSAVAQRPAMGSSAFAASAAELTCWPEAPRVAAVAMMIANMMRHEKAMPVTTSIRPSRIARRRARGVRCDSVGARGPPRSWARSSSTRCAVCQKNMYGEIDVPSTATVSPR